MSAEESCLELNARVSEVSTPVVENGRATIPLHLYLGSDFFRFGAADR
jgi:hypothetical protein